MIIIIIWNLAEKTRLEFARVDDMKVRRREIGQPNGEREREQRRDTDDKEGK